MKPVLGILLATGSSRRFGLDKLSRSLPEGDWAAVGLPKPAGGSRPGIGSGETRRPELAEKLRGAGAEAIICAEAKQGMGASLALYGSIFPERLATGRGWLVALAEMP